jgi:hypothetical protein
MSMIALISPRPRKRWRTTTIAQAIPNTVVIGIAASTMMIVSQNACWASGVVTDSQAWAKPSSKAL